MNDPAQRVQALTSLTQRLTARLSEEAAAFEAKRPQDIAAGVAETQELANHYRRESARVKADRAVIASAPLADRKALIAATQAFEAVLTRHARALDAAKTVSEGLVRTIAAEVSAHRAKGVGYGSGGQSVDGDARAVALNRTA
ncbi:flagellar basal-body protein FlbY [Brevundimonas balnearis]|uniref:Flagellar basal-body protein FlbY n=1 Tax=Brevundimonas balnearis TaxID=1572858 RepID=A0ABV6R3X5_9CAUL